MAPRLFLPNAQARALFLQRHALMDLPPGRPADAEIGDLIARLGFVQIDSIQTVARAHHMILAARRPLYRPAQLDRLLTCHRAIFEHWTHDASVIPTAFYPHWKLRFARDRARLIQRWRNWRDPEYLKKFDAVLAQIARYGPVTSTEVGTDEPRSSGGWWDWHPSKTALEYLWRIGALTVVRRDGFQKVYDLTERVLPKLHAAPPPPEAETVAWACAAALDRLGFATSGEIAAFFALVTPQEARDWCASELAVGRLREIEVEGADGRLRRCFAAADLPAHLVQLPPLPGRVRILSPFDPMLRDRARTERLFGFHYRIEVFVPAAKRRYGYYVFPVLEGDRLIGRLDARARRDDGVLAVRAFWPERGVAMGRGRRARIEAAIGRLARLGDCERAEYTRDWLRAPM